jgi:hypothetical protein
MKPKLYIATPAHDHRLDAGYVFSLLHLIASGMYPVQPSKVGGTGVARARNNQVAEFRKSNCTHFFCIDSDITFKPEHIAALVEAKKPIVCGLYALKQEKLSWCINTLPSKEADSETGLQEVASSGTGFMCVERETIERMIHAHPELAYVEDLNENKGEVRHDLFRMGVVDAVDGKPGRYLTEDWYFCRMARELGIPVYVDTRFHLLHTGQINFPLKDPMEDVAESKVDAVV